VSDQRGLRAGHLLRLDQRRARKAGQTVARHARDERVRIGRGDVFVIELRARFEFGLVVGNDDAGQDLEEMRPLQPGVVIGRIRFDRGVELRESGGVVVLDVPEILGFAEQLFCVGTPEARFGVDHRRRGGLACRSFREGRRRGEQQRHGCENREHAPDHVLRPRLPPIA
jgi:hypothetical protein